MEEIVLTEEEQKEIDMFKNFYNEAYINYLQDTYHSYDNNKKEPYYISYTNIIKRFAALCYSLNIELIPLYINLIFEYMMWGGFFSKNHNYSYRLKNRKNNMACFGADIMLGHGVCLNHTEMLSRCFKELGYESHVISVDVDDNSVTNDSIYRPNIERSVERTYSLFNKFLSIFKPVIKSVGNHALTIVKDKGEYYIFDPTNLLCLEPSGLKKARFIEGSNDIVLKLWFMALTEDITRDDFIRVYEELNIQSKRFKRFDDIENYKFLCNDYINGLRSNEDILNKFYYKNEDDINIVAKTLTDKKSQM